MSVTSSDATRPAPQVRDRLRAVTLGRLLALTGVSLLLGTTGRNMVDPAGWALLVWAGLGYLVWTVVVLALPARHRVQRVALDVSLLADAAALGITLAVTGGPASPLAFLLYAEVVALTLVFGWWTGVRICVLLSIALAWATSTGPPSLVAIVDAVRDSDLAMASALDPTVRTVLLLLGMWFVAGLVATLSTVTERELRGLIDDLAMLRDVNHELDSSQSLAQVSDGVASTLVDTFGYERAVVWLLEDDELVASGGAGLDPSATGDLGNRRVSAKSYPLQNALRSGVPWPVRRDDPRPGAVERMLGTETPLVLVPLGTDEQLIGLISAEVPRRVGRPPRLRERDVRLLAMLAGEASLVLDNARLHAELKARAVTDALTGLPNHGFFQQRLQEEVDRLNRKVGRDGTGDLAVVLFDLDHFKDVNDTFGHPTGDRVLRTVAQAAKRVLRSADVVCRYGGEEFAVILPDTTGPQAVRTCERVRAALHELEVEADEGRPVGRITASFGVAADSSGMVDRATLLAEADGALYQAKRAGRDRIARANDNDPELSPAP
jgi:two-component system, cell cycle response regulator